MNLLARGSGLLAALLLTAGTVAAYKSTVGYQLGNSGLGMELVQTKEQLADRVKANEVPPALPPAPQGGALASEAYKNVQVLGHLSSGEFTRLMTAMSIWVAPEQGCAYCHAHQKDASGNEVKNGDGYAQADPNNMQSDEIYAKRVARRMLQMTMRINGDWKQQHVKSTGVTCYTCHRGNPVPKYIWFDTPEVATGSDMLGNKAHQNSPAPVAGLTSLPNNALETFLAGDDQIRVQATQALDSDDRSSIKETEWTYALMMHMSNSLGVNCTYCHNTRSFGFWDSSPPARGTAWYGIRMVRELNHEYLGPLASTLPPERLGPAGDGPKVSCATCHQGAFKPLLGVSMLGDYMVLAEARPQPQPKPAAAVLPPVDMMPGMDAGALAADGGPATSDGGQPNPQLQLADGGPVQRVPGLADGGAPAAVPGSGSARRATPPPSASHP